MGMGQIWADTLQSSKAEGVVKDSTDGEGLNGWSTAERWTRTLREVNQFSGKKENENKLNYDDSEYWYNFD